MKLVVVPIVSLLACVESGPGPQGKKVDPTYIQSHLVSAVPADIERFDLALDGVTYVGNKVDKTRVPPGQPVTITHYWKVDRPIGDRWRVFSQLRGPPNTADYMNLVASDMQAGHGPATWQAGEIIEDIQTITIRPDWRSPEASVVIGLIEIGKHGTLDRMNVEGPRTRDRAIVARVLEIDLARAPAPKGSVYVQRAMGAIVIDGAAGDPGWAGVQQAELVPAEGAGGEPTGKAVGKLAWDDENLYAWVSVTDNDITTPYKNQDDPLWKGDCVELFIDADNNRAGYVELQVNPHNATFDSWFETTRAKPGDEAWDSGMVTAVKLRGSADAADSGDIGWDAEIAIPWAAVLGNNDNMKVRLPPEVGDRFRLNVVRVDRKSGNAKDVWASSWNRITMSDFHALDRMVVAVFADKTGSIIPQAKDPNAPATGSGSGGSTLLPKPVPAQVTTALHAMQGTIELEVQPTSVRFADADLDDAQLEAFLKLAFARDKQTKLVLRVSRGVPDTRPASLASLAKSLGFANPSVIAGPPAAGSGSARGPAEANPGSGSGAAKPAVGSGSGSGSAKPAAGSGSAKPAAGSAAGSGSARGPAEANPGTGSAAKRSE
ncbi:MAG: carbohydrate-binding family 9-like protein [Deltaproteobacteria bacterium]|nr:carbohydrate-binding family 9-like protein [Deltaproteobacteria bacterium]